MAKIKQENRVYYTECHVLEDKYGLCICLRYAKIRNRFNKPYYIKIPSKIKFTQLMNNYNVKDMNNLASFIKSLFTGIICIY